MRGIGEPKSRGPMGFRSTSVRREPGWEDPCTYVPSLVYVLAGSRAGILRRLFGSVENQ